MTDRLKAIGYFAGIAVLIVGTGQYQSWNSALVIVNMGLISAIMALGVNLQWGIAGLLNVGIMGFVALGGLATVLISMPPVREAWDAGGLSILLGLAIGAATIALAAQAFKRLPKGATRIVGMLGVLLVGFFFTRVIATPAIQAVEAVNPASTGYLGGLGLPVLLAWPVGGVLAAGVAWVIGKTALGLRSDYLAIATLGISEIIIAVLKNEDWLSRGVKNVIGVPRPVPYEVDLQVAPWFIERAAQVGLDVTTASTLYVKINYGILFTIVLLILLWLSQNALNSPWGRMMRAIRDNEVSARAMGKNVTARHLQVFVLGSAICGIAGAMMTTMDAQLTPSSYQPLRYTFLIWVMVIVGGSGNNLGAVLGGFLVWFLWVQVEPFSQFLMSILTSPLADGSVLKDHLLANAAHMRLLTMGLFLLFMLRFRPRGLLPEK